MFIKQIEIQGFKSFPEKTKIIFHPGVTIIVGPNGCGKSNIVDSVLWVLGEQRLKNIRGDRTEDIIFNGNSRRPPLGMVYVSLIIGNEEKELIIEHRAFRDGESEYKLNGKRVRLKEIQDALWAEGIGEKEYFVISQGNINQIVTAKPAERRLFLEEAAGIGKYRERKRQTQNKLFESEQNLIRLEDIIAEVEKQKNLLKRQASAARRYRILRERIRTLSFVYFREKIKDLRKNQKEVLENYHEFFGKEKEIFKRIKSEEIKFTKIENNIWNQENILKKLRSNLFSLNSRISKLIALKEKEEKRLEYLKDRIQKAKSDLKENNYELGQLEDRTQKLTEEENTLEKIYKNKEIEAEGIRKKHNSIKEELEKLQDEIRRREEEKINLQQDLISLRNEILITNKEKENLSNQIRKSINDLEGENKLLENKKQNLTQIEKEFTALKNSLKKSKEKITSLEDQIGKYKNLIESIKKNLQEKREKLQNVLNQLKFYEKLKKETSPTQSENNTMLVEFIEVESDYLKPADAFWKEELKAIPIEIKDLINLLNNKVNLKGFFLLPKENIKSESNIPQGILNESNVLGILKAKIKIKQKYQKFLFSLQDAVVMKDMNSALNLWLKYPEVNFITLEGDIILKNGLIKFSQEEGILKIQKQIKEALKSKKVLEREISLLESNLKEKKGELETLISELNNENNSYSEYERKYLEKSKDYEFLKKEIENLKNRVNVFKQELEISQKEEKLLEEKINKLYLKEKEIQKKISEEDKLFFQTKKKFSELQEKFKNISEESIKINGEINLIQEKMKNLTNTLNSLK
ncbi:AAA family ATPase, partial [SCandidatus Aminicenantes bacterium Aminicenantia_JdfR_composite]|nr:AAA family ATPase [SCandidatus Aminicenantes bacterium Aminicenantia_JdfR_composite]